MANYYILSSNVTQPSKNSKRTHSKLLEETILEKEASDSDPDENPNPKKHRILHYHDTEKPYWINQIVSSKDRIQMSDPIDSLYEKASKHSKGKKTVRLISPCAEKILDAPEIRNDYYLQLLDWGVNNFVAIALNQSVYVYNVATSQRSTNYVEYPPNSYVSSVAWMGTQNQVLAVGLSNNIVHIWDIEKQKNVRALYSHSGRVGCLVWNQCVLSSGSKDGCIINNDIRSKDGITAKLTGHSKEVCGLRWNWENDVLASGANDDIVILWDQRNSLKGNLI